MKNTATPLLPHQYSNGTYAEKGKGSHMCTEAYVHKRTYAARRRRQAQVYAQKVAIQKQTCSIINEADTIEEQS